MRSKNFRLFGIAAAAAVAFAPAVAEAQARRSAAPAAAGGSVLRVVPHANLTLLDPTWTSIYITRNHGYMIYDTLFAVDAEGKPKPQMVDTWTTSPDGLTWTFKLRDGLKWHDGGDVTAEDCIASLKRWGSRSGVGQELMNEVSALSASDPKTITMTLRRPYPYVLQSLANLSSYVPFMLPKRLAEIDPAKPVEEQIGSGPFIFKKDEFVAGSKATYLKNPAYVPRSEPPSWAAGGKVVKVDRVTWNAYPSQARAVDALIAGRVDYLEEVNPRNVERLEKRRDIVVGLTGPDPFIGMARFNHLAPPFNKPGIRRAVMMAMNQADYMKAAVAIQKYWRTCYSAFPCNSPLASETGSDFIKNGSIDAAKKALQDAGYDGTPVVILNATDIPVIAAFNRVTAGKLRALGMKVEVKPTTWAQMTLQRAERSGWSMFHTFWATADLADPRHIAFSGDPVNGWFGWPDDKELESLRDAYSLEGNADEQKKIAVRIQERIWAIGASAYLGEFFLPVAYRKAVEGVIVAPVQFYWNMSIRK
ncbi:MAG: ABC transporter substrate-binding protein [Pseudolabrys sp.]